MTNKATLQQLRRRVTRVKDGSKTVDAIEMQASATQTREWLQACIVAIQDGQPRPPKLERPASSWAAIPRGELATATPISGLSTTALAGAALLFTVTNPITTRSTPATFDVYLDSVEVEWN